MTQHSPTPDTVCPHGNRYVCKTCGLVQEYPSPTPDKELREQFKAAHNRFHGRFDTHGEVARKANWESHELEGVQIQDEELFYDELEALISAAKDQLLTELLERREDVCDYSTGGGNTFEAVPIAVIQQYLSNQGRRE